MNGGQPKQASEVYQLDAREIARLPKVDKLPVLKSLLRHAILITAVHFYTPAQYSFIRKRLCHLTPKPLLITILLQTSCTVAVCMMVDS